MKEKKPLFRMKVKRMERGLTQKELASKVGVKPMTIYNYESGEHSPPLETLKRIASALECTIDEIV